MGMFKHKRPDVLAAKAEKHFHKQAYVSSVMGHEAGHAVYLLDQGIPVTELYFDLNKNRGWTGCEPRMFSAEENRVFALIGPLAEFFMLDMVYGDANKKIPSSVIDGLVKGMTGDDALSILRFGKQYKALVKAQHRSPMLPPEEYNAVLKVAKAALLLFYDIDRDDLPIDCEPLREPIRSAKQCLKRNLAAWVNLTNALQATGQLNGEEITEIWNASQPQEAVAA